MTATLLALAVSTLYIILTSLIAYWSRKYTEYYVRDSFLKSLFLEGIATAELCGACFELIINGRIPHGVAQFPELSFCRFKWISVADNWGVSMYAIYLFVLTIWWSLNWGDATACPYTHLEELVEGKKSARNAFLLIWAELVGGLVVFRYIQLLWALEIVPTHKDRAFEDCTTDLQVPVIYGAFIECLATCMCRVASRILSDLNPRFATAIDSFVGTSLVVAAFNYSGGYFNPALATALKYGCLGTSFMEHVIVYWVGACAGSVASISVYKMNFVQNFIRQQKEKVV